MPLDSCRHKAPPRYGKLESSGALIPRHSPGFSCGGAIQKAKGAATQPNHLDHRSGPSGANRLGDTLSVTGENVVDITSH